MLRSQLGGARAIPLFDQFERTETRLRGANEGNFDYLNISARPAFKAIRDLLEGWFEHLPNAAKADVRGRFRSRDDAQHQSAFFELFWHELLRSSGYEVEIHPTVPNETTNPDFLARQNGNPQFYLEATLAMPPGDPAAGRRLAQLHDTLDRMDSPDFFIEIQHRGNPEGNIRGRALREQLERWLRQLTHEEISRLYQEGNFGAVPTLTCSEEGLLLTFTPIPKSAQARGQPGIRPIGIVMPEEMRGVRTHDDIRAAVEGKATKYGALELPLLIAVNVMDDFCDDDDVRNALFGEEQVVATRQADGQWQHEWGMRAPNGAWYGRRGPRNALVSGVIVSHALVPTTLRVRTVELIHNPWASQPLPLEALPFPQRTVSLADGQVSLHPGARAADLLGICEPWPVPDPPGR